MKDTTIAVDLAKNVFEIAISREAGKVSKQHRVSRPKLVSFFAKQSAATVLRAANVSKSPPDKLRAWARKVHRSRGHNKAAIAVANKLARIVWAVSTRESEFQSVPAAA